MKLRENRVSPVNAGCLFWIVISGIILYAILDAVVQLLPPHYNLMSQAESDLAVGPYGYIMAINFVNRGVFSLIFVYALIQFFNAKERRRYRAGLSLLSVWGISSLLLAAFPTDVPSTSVSLHGAIHLGLAILAFLSAAFGELSLALRFNNDDRLNSSRLTLPLAVLVVLFCLAELGLPLVIPHLVAPVSGLIERIFLGSTILWIGVVSGCVILRNRVSTLIP